MSAHPTLINDVGEFIHYAENWQAGDSFPLLASTALESYRDQAGGELPPVPVDERPGVVISCGGPGSRALGRLLATATARRHVHTAPSSVPDAVAALGGGYAAIVGLPEDLDAAGDWPGGTAVRAGVVTARGTAYLSALIYRCLTAGTLERAAPLRLTHPAMPGGATADVVSIEDIGLLQDGRPRLLALRSHGRECCIHLPDGIICGRSGPPPSAPEPVPAVPRVPSCSHGEGCFRHDLTEAQRVPAAELAATVVFAHSCNSVAIGVNAFPHHVSVSLAFLEGTAAAVIGTLGQHEGDPRAEHLVAQMLESGERLGDIVSALNALGRDRSGEYSRFVLLGDPAMKLASRHRDRALGSVRWIERPVRTLPPDSVTELRHLAEVVLPGLELACWLDCGLAEAQLGALRTEVRAAWQACVDGKAAALRSFPDSVRELTARAHAVQFEAVAAFARTMYRTWWRFGGMTLDGFRQLSSEAHPCPHCGLKSARSLRFEHMLRPALRVTVRLCRRCGPTSWHAGPTSGRAGRPEVEHQAPADVRGRRGEKAVIRLTVVNRGTRPVRGAVAHSQVNGIGGGLPAPVSWEVTLPPGECREFEVPVDLSGPGLVCDVHEGAFISLLDGVLAILPTQLTVIGAGEP
jgi:hypothetical protein